MPGGTRNSGRLVHTLCVLAAIESLQDQTVAELESSSKAQLLNDIDSFFAKADTVAECTLALGLMEHDIYMPSLETKLVKSLFGMLTPEEAAQKQALGISGQNTLEFAKLMQEKDGKALKEYTVQEIGRAAHQLSTWKIGSTKTVQPLLLFDEKLKEWILSGDARRHGVLYECATFKQVVTEALRNVFKMKTRTVLPFQIRAGVLDTIVL